MDNFLLSRSQTLPRDDACQTGHRLRNSSPLSRPGCTYSTVLTAPHRIAAQACVSPKHAFNRTRLSVLVQPTVSIETRSRWHAVAMKFGRPFRSGNPASQEPCERRWLVHTYQHPHPWHGSEGYERCSITTRFQPSCNGCIELQTSGLVCCQMRPAERGSAFISSSLLLLVSRIAAVGDCALDYESHRRLC